MHVICPHCRSPLELTDAGQHEVTCPTCGSSFRMQGDPTTVWKAQSDRKVGKFILLEVVGQGAFGVVYKARDPELDRFVAVKIPRPGNYGSSESDTERFLREARSVAQLRHPSIVSVYEVGQVDGMPYLVSDFVEGITLADWLSAQRTTPRQAADWVAQAADGLQYAHDHGIVHRDVKPSNLMLETTDGENGPTVCAVKLMDFGLARREAGEVTLTLDGQVLGTPAYMSPEQARGEAHRVDGRGDVYSLGVVLYQMLTGELPFRGTQRMLLYQVLTEEPRSLRSLNDRTPRDLETITLKCLQKEPGRRYATAGELAADLRRYLKGEPITARPVGRGEKSWRWCRRNPAVAGLTAAVAVSLLAGTAVSAWFGYQASERAADAERSAASAREAQQEASAKADEALRSAGAERAAKEMAGRHLYAARMTLIRRYWDEGQTREVLTLLDRLKPAPGEENLRGWEWNFQRRLCEQEIYRLPRQPDVVSAVAWSPDGRRLAVVGRAFRGGVKVWDAAAGRELCSLRGHADWVTGLAFLPDGKALATVSEDGTVKLWGLDTGQVLRTMPAPSLHVANRVRNIVVSPDGRLLATATEGGAKRRDVTVWAADSGAEVATLSGHGNYVASVAFSPDGKLLASAGYDGAVRLWDLAVRREVWHFREPDGKFMSVAFSPDGRQVTAGGWNKRVYVWEVGTWRRRHAFTNPEGVFDGGVTFSPDGSWLGAASHDNSVWLWELKPGGRARRLRHPSIPCALAFSPDGLWLATGDWNGEVRLWDWPSDPATPLVRVPGQWSVKSGDRLVFRPDGRRLVSSGSQLKCWHTVSGQELFAMPGPVSAAFSPDGRWVVLGKEDGTVRVWDGAFRREHRAWKAHEGRVTAVAFGPHGKRLATGSGEAEKTAELTVWDFDGGRALHSQTWPSNFVAQLAFTPDGRYLAAACCGWAPWVELVPGKVFTGDGSQEVREPPTKPFSPYGVASSPDSRFMASAHPSALVNVWEVGSWKRLYQLRGHHNRAQAVAFSRDGRRLASVALNWGKPTGVKLWDVVSGQELYSIKDVEGNDVDVTFSPDGGRLVTAGTDGTVRIYDGRPLTDEVRAEREAVGVLNALFAKPLRKADVAEYVRSHAVMRPAARKQALELIAHYREESDPMRYHLAGLALVRQPYLNRQQYRFALWQARAATQLAPQDGTHLALLGMAQSRSGDQAAARASLARARELAKGADAQALLREAAELIEGAPPAAAK